MVSNINADWRLVDPSGNIVFNSTLGVDAGRFTLPFSGTYTLLLEGAIANTGAFGYEFKVDTPQVEVVASDPGVPFVNLTGITDLNNATFNVQLQGNGQAQAYDVQFVAPASGIQLGAIPVAIDTQYRYQLKAADADGDPLTFSLTQAPLGMQIDATTGLISWSPTAAQLGSNAVSVRVADDHGGFDVQNFTVNVINSAPGQIQGTVFNDANGDGTRTFTSSDPAPAGGPFLPLGAPFPAIGDDTEPAIVITFGPGGAMTTTYTGQGPYDGEDDTYIAVVNAKDSGIAVQSIRLSSSDLMGYDWGQNNVRELRNVLERMVIAANGDVIGAEHVPADIRDHTIPQPMVPARSFIARKAEAERRIVVEALERNAWHITRTAQDLELADHASLLKIMRRLGIDSR